MERYTLGRLIGEGSYGNAYLCTLKDDAEKMYVLKKIGLGKLDQVERETAWHEVKILKQLKHPFVLSHIDSFTHEEDLCIITDYCDGGDLFSRLKVTREFFPEEWILEKFVQICLALEYLHKKQILHRDIKSQNVFCQKDGTIKLGDFGIAKVLSSPVDMAKTLIGTPYFMSPEVMSNKPYDFRSDVWGLGCILYEMASLKRAFDASCMNGLALKILRGKIEPLPPQYSDNLRKLSTMLFSKDPENRPTCSEILKLAFLEPFVVIHRKLAAERSREWDSEDRGMTFVRPGLGDLVLEYFAEGFDDQVNDRIQTSAHVENPNARDFKESQEPADHRPEPKLSDDSKKMIETTQKSLAGLEMTPSKDRVLLEKERRRKDAEEQKVLELRRARIEYANKRKAASTKQAEIYQKSDTLQRAWAEESDEAREHLSEKEDTAVSSLGHNGKDRGVKPSDAEGHQTDIRRSESLSSNSALERASAIRLLCTYELGEDLFNSLYKYMFSKIGGPYTKEDRKEEAEFFDELKGRLGETKMQYVHLIDHLIYLEERLSE